MKKLKDIGIDFQEITEKLTADGVVLFANSFKELLEEIDRKKKDILAQTV